MFNYIGLIVELQIRFFLEAAEKTSLFEDMIRVLGFIEHCKKWYLLMNIFDEMKK